MADSERPGVRVKGLAGDTDEAPSQTGKAGIPD